jgi:hypothetical protein
MSANLVDSALELLDLSDKLLLFEWFLVQEIIDSGLFLEQEQEFVVDIDALRSGLQVLVNDLFDDVLSLLDDLVFGADVPQVRLVVVRDLSVSPGDLVDLLYHGGHDLNELITHIG